MNICPTCKTKEKADGYDYCEICHRHRSVQTHRDFKKACLLYKDAQHPNRCEGCKKEYRQDCLCFRHILSRKDNVPISKFSGSSVLSSAAKAELDRCAVLCRNCEAKEYRSSRGPSLLKKRALAEKGGKCSNCNYGSCASALEFHHTDGRGAPTKRLTLGQRGLNRYDEVADELAKVVIMCSNCHAELHAVQKERERMKEKAELFSPAVAQATPELEEEIARELAPSSEGGETEALARTEALAEVLDKHELSK